MAYRKLAICFVFLLILSEAKLYAGDKDTHFSDFGEESFQPEPEQERPSLGEVRVRKRAKSKQTKPVNWNDPFYLSVLAHTPLVEENTFDKRFKAFGGTLLLAAPFTNLSPYFLLMGEMGLITTVASVSVLGTSFTHIYFNVPVYLRLLYLISERLRGEIFAGLEMKLLEYDSRPTTDGGVFFVNDFFGNFSPDAGVGISYELSEVTALRLRLGYLYLSVGAEFRLN